MACDAYSTSRRALLSGLAVLPLGGCAPALAAWHHPDADLLALQPQWDAAEAAYKAACHRSTTLEAATVLPEAPKAIFYVESDTDLGLYWYTSGHKGGERWYYLSATGADKPGDSIRSPRRKQGLIPPPKGHRLYGKTELMSGAVDWPESQARADEIISAFDKWMSETRAAKVASGYHQAEEEVARLGGVLSAVEARIAEARATTLDGVLVKARLMQDTISSGSEPDDDLVSGLLSDLLALGGQA